MVAEDKATRAAAGTKQATLPKGTVPSSETPAQRQRPSVPQWRNTRALNMPKRNPSSDLTSTQSVGIQHTKPKYTDNYETTSDSNTDGTRSKKGVSSAARASSTNATSVESGDRAKVAVPTAKSNAGAIRNPVTVLRAGPNSDGPGFGWQTGGRNAVISKSFSEFPRDR
jgi:hypothetical protein